MKEIAVGDVYKNGNGDSVRIICTDLTGDFPIAGICRSGLDDFVERYTASGRYFCGRSDCRDLAIAPDLVPLDQSDIVVGKTVIRTKTFDAVVQSAGSAGVLCYEPNGSLAPMDWSGLHKYAEYSRNGDRVFLKCEKSKP